VLLGNWRQRLFTDAGRFCWRGQEWGEHPLFVITISWRSLPSTIALTYCVK